MIPMITEPLVSVVFEYLDVIRLINHTNRTYYGIQPLSVVHRSDSTINNRLTVWCSHFHITPNILLWITELKHTDIGLEILIG